MIVLILYGLIYSSVTKQRAKRRAQKMGGRVKQVNTHCQTDECTIPLTNVKSKSKVNSNHNNISLKVEMDGETTTTRLMPDEQTNGVKDAENKIVKNSSIRKPGAQDHTKDRKDHDRLANIKTAVMLFIVTIVFILAFLPAWLMAHRWITFYNVIFYMYFVYNVANPVIYAFMNQMFRDNMCKIFNSCRNVATRP
jgi:cation transport ATPase